LIFAVASILCGLIWRLAPLHLPPFLFKYGGSALYAVMIYWLLAALWPRMQIPKLALAAIITVSAIEAIKLVHQPQLDAFRMTLAGKLLLGRFFSFSDLLAYALAIVVLATLDEFTGRLYQRTSGNRLE
jgi:hypothetical protein